MLVNIIMMITNSSSSSSLSSSTVSWTANMLWEWSVCLRRVWLLSQMCKGLLPSSTSSSSSSSSWDVLSQMCKGISVYHPFYHPCSQWEKLNVGHPIKTLQAELQTCGGASDISGRCADGLQCLKTCRKLSTPHKKVYHKFPRFTIMSNYFLVPCKTVGDRGRPCIFPFK